jgi:hypothetical protein
VSRPGGRKTEADGCIRKWAGCPQALQGRKCDPDESKTRIWLREDGTAEVSLGAEVSSDQMQSGARANSMHNAVRTGMTKEVHCM